MTKLEAVKDSLAHLGDKATVREMLEDIKQRHDMTISLKYLRRLRKETLESKKKRVKPAATAAPAAPVKKEGTKSVLMEDILSLRAIADRIGFDNLRTLLKVME